MRELELEPVDCKLALEHCKRGLAGYRMGLGDCRKAQGHCRMVVLVSEELGHCSLVQGDCRQALGHYRKVQVLCRQEQEQELDYKKVELQEDYKRRLEG